MDLVAQGHMQEGTLFSKLVVAFETYINKAENILVEIFLLYTFLCF
jgi:hypothetical protein